MLKETKWSIILAYPYSLSRKDKDYHYGKKKKRKKRGRGREETFRKKKTKQFKLEFIFPLYTFSISPCLSRRPKQVIAVGLFHKSFFIQKSDTYWLFIKLFLTFCLFLTTGGIQYSIYKHVYKNNLR